MDNIDITDSAFALDTSSVNSILNVGSDSFTDYTIFIYIGAAIFVIIIAVFIHKLYNNKLQQEDCQGGFCTMENSPNVTI